MADEGDEQAPVRVPLALATTPRNADLTKDALLKNCFIDGSQMGNKYAVKRPGFLVGSEAITTGLNRGIYVSPNNPSGGNPGETEIWYIDGSGGLSSFSYNPSPPSTYSVDFLLAASGGAGQNGGGVSNIGGNGGSGGQVITGTSLLTSGNSYSIVIGVTGNNSTFDINIALSGTTGAGGSGGLSGLNGDNGVAGVASTISGISLLYGSSGAGGGGSWPGIVGIGADGQPGTDGSGGGGSGREETPDDGGNGGISGTGALGGAGGLFGVPGNGAGGNGGVGTRGNGGGGGGAGDAIGGSNGVGGTSTGIFVLSYPGDQRGTGGTVTSVGGNTIHTFTTSGTYIA